MSNRKRKLLLITACLLTEEENAQEENEQKRKRMWAKDWLKKRNELGAFQTIIHELRVKDEKGFKQMLRLDVHLFDKLLDMVATKIKKQDTTYRQSISPPERLAITLNLI